MNGYRDLIAWQKSIALVVEIYKMTELFPKTETYGLSSQAQRAAVSIPSNIAEGWRRPGVKEKIHFYAIAFGSASELETQVEIAFRLHYISQETREKLLASLDEISRILYKITNHKAGE